MICKGGTAVVPKVQSLVQVEGGKLIAVSPAGRSDRKESKAAPGKRMFAGYLYG